APHTFSIPHTVPPFGGAVFPPPRASEPYFRRRIGRIFTEFDVILAPTTATAPPPVGAIDTAGHVATDRIITAACPYAWPWNVLGWPSVNVPAGFTDAGLPRGAQLMGPESSEPLLVSLAAQLEHELHWDRAVPARWW
ncbi:amidase family protein, partial [Rhodococcus sp. NPDC054953]